MAHKKQMYENLRDMLEREVGEIERKRELTKDSLDNLFKLTASLKVVDKCIEREEMEEEEKNGGSEYSQARGRGRMGRMGYSYDDGMSNGMMPYWNYPMMSNGMSNMSPMSNTGMSNGMGTGMNSNANMSNTGMSNAGNSYDNSNMGNSNRSYEVRGSYNNSNDGRRGRDGDGDGRYSEDRGGNFRGNSNRGSYSRDGQYSRDASRKKMVQKLETLMDDTMSENERNAIQDCITKIDK